MPFDERLKMGSTRLKIERRCAGEARRSLVRLCGSYLQSWHKVIFHHSKNSRVCLLQPTL